MSASAYTCDYVHSGTACAASFSTPLALVLHKADRHLIYPPEGLAAVDPILIAEQRERRKGKAKASHPDPDAEGDPEGGATIAGLNIALDSEELVQQWIEQRKKRWPTTAVVAQKNHEREQRRKRTEQVYGPAPNNRKRPQEEPPPEKKAKTTDEDEEEEEDEDAPPVEISSKQIPEPEEAEQDTRPICKHFLQNRCSFGDRCRKRHGNSTQPPPKRRPQPRAPPPNPFAQPDLLRQLLKNEIQRHVDAVAQVIRFIVDNDMLEHVEKEVGAAEEQKKRRALIQVLDSDPLPAPSVEQPVVSGALPVAKGALFRPPSPSLRPLDALKYPPEPDPLIYLDPLRRDDPKPLQHAQLVSIATDPSLRAILTPTSSLHPYGAKQRGLERALISLDALPTDAYRNAALEMILGVSESNTAQGLATTIGGRRVTESDLFRLGLRVGYEEVSQLRELADCVSRLLEGGVVDTLEAREEARRAHWAQEGERLAKLRKLGIDVD